LDASTFDVQPPIVDFEGVDNSTNDRHGIEGYLTDPRVAREIHAALAAG